MNNLLVRPSKKRPATLRPLPKKHGKGSTVLLDQADMDEYKAALATFGLSGHNFLRCCVAALIEANQAQQKTANLLED